MDTAASTGATATATTAASATAAASATTAATVTATTAAAAYQPLSLNRLYAFTSACQSRPII